MWAVKPPVAQDALSALLSYSMTEWTEATRRYRLHDLARVFADQRLADGERLDAARRHAAYYLGVLGEANRLYLEGDDRVVEGLALFDLERANVEAGQAWAASYSAWDNEATQLSSAYANVADSLLNLRQHPRQRIQWLEAAMAAATRTGDRDAEAQHLTNLGLASASLNELPRAVEFYQGALRIYRDVGDRRREGQCLNHMGVAYRRWDDEPRRAIELFSQSLVIAREVDDRRGEGRCLGT